MSDTNWCTFCDCAVSPLLNLIYCSEECFKKDAISRHPLYLDYIEQQQSTLKQLQLASLTTQFTIDPSIISLQHYRNKQQEESTSYYTPHQDNHQDNHQDSSTSSLCSEDLAAIHFDMIIPEHQPNITQQTTPTTVDGDLLPLLSKSTSISLASHTSNSSSGLPTTPLHSSLHLPITTIAAAKVHEKLNTVLLRNADVSQYHHKL